MTTGYTLVPFSETPEQKLEISIVTTRIVWLEYPNSVTCYVNNKSQILKVGDYITYEGRNGTGVMIIQICGYKEDEGPIGIRYLPWREDGRWATQQFSLRGDMRFIICYPSGMMHHGQHIIWNTVENINHLAPDHHEYQKKLHSITHPESE